MKFEIEDDAPPSVAMAMLIAFHSEHEGHQYVISDDDGNRIYPPPPRTSDVRSSP